MNTAWQNIILFAGVLNAAAVICAATGVIGPAGAAVTHQLSSFFVMMNSLRLLRVPSSGESRVGAFLRSAASRASGSKVVESIQSAFAGLEFSVLLDALISRLPEWKKALRPLLYSAAALYALSGIYTLNPDETGVVERFGHKLFPYRAPGPHYKLPWPIERLTRIQANRVRVVELGFRSNAAGVETEPAAYEWNVQHRSGRFQKVPEESLMLTGDQNMIELTATVHYIPDHPDDFLFRQLDGDATVRAAAESVIQGVTTTSSLDDVLTLHRREIETRAKTELEKRLAEYGAGVHVLQVKLEDVHPSLEVVDAFRQVSDAFEEKNRVIDEAQGYQNEQLALARGNAGATLENAAAYSLGRKARSEGDASRFLSTEQAFRGAPQATKSRLYLETMEAVLPGKKKLILDKSQNKRHLYLLQDGVELPSGLRPPAERGNMTTKKKYILAAGAFVLLSTYLSLYSVRETEFALVTQFGRPVRTVANAGLHVKWPFHSILWFDRRLRIYNPRPSEFLTRDKKNLVIENYVAWRIDDPNRFVQSVGDTSAAEMRLHDIIWSGLSAALGTQDLESLVSATPDRAQAAPMLDALTATADRAALAQYGIRIVDVRIKRLNLPEQNKQSVFARMRAERERIALQYRAEGEQQALTIRASADRQKEEIISSAYKDAEKVRGEGDAEATRIYGQAYSKNPEFYKLLRTLDSYKKVLDDKTTIILSSDSELLKVLTRGEAGAK